MARQRDPRRKEAFQIWKKHDGKITNRAIAEQLDVPEKTVGGWKSKDKWNGVLQSKIRSTPKEKKQKEVFVESDELNDKQRLFCIYYIKYFNATKAYQKAYEVNRNTAESIAYRLMDNDGVKAEIRRLKAQRLKEAYFDKNDVLQKYKDIAFADISDFITFGQREQQVMTMYGPLFEKNKNGKADRNKPVMETVNYIDFNESTDIDGTIVTEVKLGRDGASVKLADKMKALEMLSKFTDLLSDNDKKRLQEEKLKTDIAKSNAEIEKLGENEDDGPIEIMISRKGGR